MKKHLLIAIEAAVLAGKEIMKHYSQEKIETELKIDHSPLTIADRKANEVINRYLLPTSIPIISEENEEIPYQERKTWDTCWIVDPLDGTKEFINKNGEFTVNIALTSFGKPALGIIFAPALDVLYFAVVNDGKAFRYEGAIRNPDYFQILNEASEISPEKSGECFRILGSRSHLNEETEKLYEMMRKKHPKVEVISKGSSLKFCLVAEGAAHYYPRLGPTMEWDTAAGQAICEAVGVFCRSSETGKDITYNRENLRNGNFSVFYEG